MMAGRRRGPRIVSVIATLSGSLVIAALAIWTGPRWLVPGIASRATGCIYAVHTRDRVVALTVDDGPDPAETPTILRALRINGARATFFLISTHVTGHDALVDTIIASGHEIGNHLTRDEPSIRMTPNSFDRAVRDADTVLRAFAPVRWLRPGSGWYTPAMIRTIERAGYRCALGSIYPFDAQLPSPAFASAYILANVRPGAVIVLHDRRGRGRRTAETLQRVLPVLRARGYQVVSLSDLCRHEVKPTGS